MTLRALWWAAAEKRSQLGLLAAWATARIVECIPFNEARIDPERDNPFKEERPEDPAVAKAREFISRRMWAARTGG
jgi:hypothetical protein